MRALSATIKCKIQMGSRNRPWIKIWIQNPTLTLTLIRTWIWTPTHTLTRVRIWTSTRTRPWLGSEPGLGIRTAHQSKHHVNAIVPKSAFSLLWRLIMCNSPHLRRPCSNRSTSNGRLRRVCCCGTDGRTETDRRTPDRCIDPALHAMRARAVPIKRILPKCSENFWE